MSQIFNNPRKLVPPCEPQEAEARLRQFLKVVLGARYREEMSLEVGTAELSKAVADGTLQRAGVTESEIVALHHWARSAAEFRAEIVTGKGGPLHPFALRSSVEGLVVPAQLAETETLSSSNVATGEATNSPRLASGNQKSEPVSYSSKIPQIFSALSQLWTGLHCWAARAIDSIATNTSCAAHFVASLSIGRESLTRDIFRSVFQGLLYEATFALNTKDFDVIRLCAFTGASFLLNSLRLQSPSFAISKRFTNTGTGATHSNSARVLGIGLLNLPEKLQKDFPVITPEVHFPDGTVRSLASVLRETKSEAECRRLLWRSKVVPVSPELQSLGFHAEYSVRGRGSFLLPLPADCTVQSVCFLNARHEAIFISSTECTVHQGTFGGVEIEPPRGTRAIRITVSEISASELAQRAALFKEIAPLLPQFSLRAVDEADQVRYDIVRKRLAAGEDTRKLLALILSSEGTRGYSYVNNAVVGRVLASNNEVAHATRMIREGVCDNLTTAFFCHCRAVLPEAPLVAIGGISPDERGNLTLGGAHTLFFSLNDDGSLVQHDPTSVASACLNPKLKHYLRLRRSVRRFGWESPEAEEALDAVHRWHSAPKFGGAALLNDSDLLGHAIDPQNHAESVRTLSHEVRQELLTRAVMRCDMKGVRKVIDEFVLNVIFKDSLSETIGSYASFRKGLKEPLEIVVEKALQSEVPDGTEKQFLSTLIQELAAFHRTQDRYEIRASSYAPLVPLLYYVEQAIALRREGLDTLTVLSAAALSLAEIAKERRLLPPPIICEGWIPAPIPPTPELNASIRMLGSCTKLLKFEAHMPLDYKVKLLSLLCLVRASVMDERLHREALAAIKQILSGPKEESAEIVISLFKNWTPCGSCAKLTHTLCVMESLLHLRAELETLAPSISRALVTHICAAATWKEANWLDLLTALGRVTTLNLSPYTEELRLAICKVTPPYKKGRGMIEAPTSSAALHASQLAFDARNKAGVQLMRAVPLYGGPVFAVDRDNSYFFLQEPYFTQLLLQRTFETGLSLGIDKGALTRRLRLPEVFTTSGTLDPENGERMLAWIAFEGRSAPERYFSTLAATLSGTELTRLASKGYQGHDLSSALLLRKILSKTTSRDVVRLLPEPAALLAARALASDARTFPERWSTLFLPESEIHHELVVTMQTNEKRFTEKHRVTGSGYSNQEGLRGRIRAKGGDDFAMLREYSLGDDVRFIDWNHAAHGSLVTKVFHQETDPYTECTHLLIDPEWFSNFRGGESAAIRLFAHTLAQSLADTQKVRLSLLMRGAKLDLPQSDKADRRAMDALHNHTKILSNAIAGARAVKSAEDSVFLDDRREGYQLVVHELLRNRTEVQGTKYQIFFCAPNLHASDGALRTLSQAAKVVITPNG